MKQFTTLLVFIALTFASCNNKQTTTTKQDSKDLASLFDKYYNERMQLVPIESTQNGDSTNNDKLYADFTDTYREKYRQFFSHYLDEIKKYNRDDLSNNDQVSYDIFKREMEMTLEGLSLGYFANTVTYPDHHYMPFTQFGGIPIWIGQQGSGDGSQPFKTVKDYDNWLKRASQFPAWADSAIVYFRKGIASNTTLPQALVKKMIPQMEAMVVSDATKSLFYGPVNKMPVSFGDSNRIRLTNAYVQLITQQLVPAYKRLGDFLRTEYLSKARTVTLKAFNSAANALPVFP